MLRHLLLLIFMLLNFSRAEAWMFDFNLFYFSKTLTIDSAETGSQMFGDLAFSLELSKKMQFTWDGVTDFAQPVTRAQRPQQFRHRKWDPSSECFSTKT